VSFHLPSKDNWIKGRPCSQRATPDTCAPCSAGTNTSTTPAWAHKRESSFPIVTASATVKARMAGKAASQLGGIKWRYLTALSLDLAHAQPCGDGGHIGLRSRPGTAELRLQLIVLGLPAFR
jgi:hypothetical protein